MVHNKVKARAITVASFWASAKAYSYKLRDKPAHARNVAKVNIAQHRKPCLNVGGQYLRIIANE
jgi:hypothetical protein